MELVINFSGGKDSCAMLALLCEQYPNVKKHVVMADTGWEHTDAVEWSKKIVAMFGLELQVVKAKKTFLSMSENRGKFPGMTTRQCTSDLKRDPIMKWIRNNVTDKVVVNCIGLRAEESTNRAKAKRLSRNKRESNSKRTIWDWLPIQDWKEGRVLGCLAENGVPLHPVYRYLRRFSCRVCIYMSQHDLRQVQANDSEAIDIIARIEEKIGFTMFNGTTIREKIGTEPVESVEKNNEPITWDSPEGLKLLGFTTNKAA